jgi:putative nucleotidyltransferase with HDIG domain
MAHVLVVDDEEAIRGAFRAVLESDGHQVSSAQSVGEATRILAGAAVDVVVSDINMPGMKGTALLKLIREAFPEVQAILVTGLPSVETAAEAVRQGAYDYLVKPVRGTELQKAVANAAKLKAAQDEKARLEREKQQHQQHLEHIVEERTAELKEALIGTISAMALTVEMRDPYTSGHQIRVAKLARAIGERLGLASEKIEGIYLAGIVHDIGKISIPAEILSKPGALCPEEFAMIKKHSRSGHAILQSIKFPWPIATIVLQHHERMDGSGYPQHLVGEAILPEARILAVADVIEAMATHRPYRAALGIEVALEEIDRMTGRLYDANAAGACIELFRNGYAL